MFGLIVLLVIAGYIAVSVWVVKATMRWARRRGRSATRWGWGAGLLMYLLVFWDFIPTVLLHRYLCATEQGFWVYKTIEQWQQENPGVAETLTPLEGMQLKEPGARRGYLLNQRFANVLLEKKDPLPFLPVSIHEERIVDLKNGQIMAKHVRIGSGYGSFAVGSEGAWKSWLKQPDCNRNRRDFASYEYELKHQGDR